MTSNICHVSSISCLLPPAAQTKPPRRLRLLPPPMAGCASAALPYPPMLATPSHYSPTHHVILRRLSPNTHPHPNQSTVVLPSACDRTGASSTAPVRSVRGLTVVLHLAALVHSPCAVCRPLALSTSPTTERNKEMTVRGEDDSWDPPASWQYASKCLYITSPKIWFLLMVASGAHPLVKVANKRENYTTSG